MRLELQPKPSMELDLILMSSDSGHWKTVSYDPIIIVHAVWKTHWQLWIPYYPAVPGIPRNISVHLVGSIRVLVTWQVPAHPNGKISEYEIAYVGQETLTKVSQCKKIILLHIRELFSNPMQSQPSEGRYIVVNDTQAELPELTPGTIYHIKVSE